MRRANTRPDFARALTWDKDRKRYVHNNDPECGPPVVVETLPDGTITACIVNTMHADGVYRQTWVDLTKYKKGKDGKLLEPLAFEVKGNDEH